MPRFLVHFGGDTASPVCFGEIRALLENAGLNADDMMPREEWAVLENPLLALDFPAAETGHKVLAAAVTAKAYYELFSAAPTLDAAVAQLATLPLSAMTAVFDARRSWRILVECHGHRRTSTAQRASVRERCAPFLPFKGRVDLSDGAGVTAAVLLDFSPLQSAEAAPPPESAGGLFGLPADRLRGVYVGTAHTTRRPLHVELALPRRLYLGPTSLEPLLALAMCNMAAVQPGAVVMDPFVGTGSILVAAARLGAAATFGVELDFRVVCMGKLGRCVASNFEQYGLPVPELVRADMADLGLREGSAGIFDAIVTDPPYGVRAGVRQSSEALHATARHTARAAPDSAPSIAAPASTEGGGGSEGAGARRCFPRTRGVEGEGVLLDLVDLAARALRVGGRLTFLYAATGGFSPSMLPCHPCLVLAQDCAGEALTPFLSRRIITMVKVAPYDFAKAAEYREVGEAAARASGTLSVGLRERMGDAYDAWLASRRKELPALVDRLVRSKGSCGGAAELEHESPREEAAAAAAERAGGEASDGGEQAPVSRGQLKKDAKRLIRQMQREQRLAAAAAAASEGTPAVPELGGAHDTADLERFAAAVGWKRGGSRGDGSAGAPDGADGVKGGSAASAPQSKRARLRQNAAQRVALMLSGELPMQIGQVPFMRPSVSAALAAAGGSGVAAAHDTGRH